MDSTRGGTQAPVIHDFYDQDTGSWQYVVADPSSLSAVIIDPVLDYQPATGTISTTNADRILDLIKEKGYRVAMLLETHVHADHMTAASYLQRRLEAMQGIDKPLIGIGMRMKMVQELFAKRYGVSESEYQGSFDKLFVDDEEFHVGDLKARAIHVPGHTPDHMGYLIGDDIFVGDSLFHIDLGSARADFPGGDASTLYHSGQKILALSDHVRVHIGHDYPPAGREGPVSTSTVKEHKQHNKHFGGSRSEKDFVQLRQERDATLNEPRLLHAALQVNIRAGKLPMPGASGDRLLHLPVKLKEIPAW